MSLILQEKVTLVLDTGADNLELNEDAVRITEVTLK